MDDMGWWGVCNCPDYQAPKQGLRVVWKSGEVRPSGEPRENGDRNSPDLIWKREVSLHCTGTHDSGRK